MKRPLSIVEEGQKLYDEIVESLQQGVTDREHPFHLISIATLGLDGTPRARMVVLRQFVRDDHVLIFHADRRSPKVHEINHHPSISLLCYDPIARTQLRMSATATVHISDALADARWVSSPVQSRRCYLAPLAPSTPIDFPRPLPYMEQEWALEQERKARQNFCAISCQVHAIDFLELTVEGHRRMNLSWDERGTLSAHPLMP